mgnify:CR=1 FL=1
MPGRLSPPRGSLQPGARVTDFMIDSKNFVAVTHVEIWGHDGRLIMAAPFINVSRDHIEIITPDVAPPSAAALQAAPNRALTLNVTHP